MPQELRTASDVLLDLESKVELLLGNIQIIDLNIKVLSNKLNEVMKSLEKPPPPKATIEAVQTLPPNQTSFPKSEDLKQRTITVSADAQFPQMGNFPRTSRPETFAGSDVYLPKPGVPAPFQSQSNQPNKPPPGRNAAENVASYITPGPTPTKPTPAPQQSSPINNNPNPQPIANASPLNQSIIPVEQRVVDSSNKSVFLANVEITDTDGNQISKSLQTKGNGKWSIPLPIGVYKVTIRKLELLTKQTFGAVQMITIDGSQNPLKLPTVIIK